MNKKAKKHISINVEELIHEEGMGVTKGLNSSLDQTKQRLMDITFDAQTKRGMLDPDLNSVGGGRGDIGENTEAMSKFTNQQYYLQDEKKLKETLALYDMFSEEHQELKSSYDPRPLSLDDDFSHDAQRSRVDLKKLQKSLMDVVFKVNYVLLSNRPVNAIGHHLIMLIEFLQMFFLIQYSIVCKNAFGHPVVSNLDLDPFMPKLLKQFSNASLYNITEENLSIRNMLSKAQTSVVQDATFRLDEIVKFANPILYTIDKDGRATYVAVYALFVGLFYFLLITLAVFGDYFYKLIRESASNQLSESSKILIRALSLAVFLFISVLQVPFMTLLFQSYLCEEDPQVQYYIDNLQCNSQEYQIFITLSTVTLCLYFGVLWIELTMFQTNEFCSKMPWASFDRQTSKFSALVKIILTAGFVLNKSASNKPYFLLIALVVTVNVIYRRFTEAIIFSKQAHLAVTSYDILIGAHLIFLPIQIFAKVSESVDLVVSYLLLALLLMMLYGYLQRRKTINMLQDDVFLNRKNIGRCEVYLQKLYELIFRANGSDLFIMQGLLSSHAEICTKKDCECVQILSHQDLLHKFELYNSKLYQFARGNSLQNIAFANTPDQPQNVYDPSLVSGSPRGVSNLAREGTIASNKSYGGHLSRMASMKGDKNQPFLMAPSPNFIGTTKANHHAPSHFGALGRSLKNQETQNQMMDVEAGDSDNIQIHVLSEYNGYNKKEEAEHAQNERMKLFEEVFGYSLDSDYPSNHYEQQAKIIKKLKKGFFKFFVVLLNRAIERFPKDPTMRLHLASVYQNTFENSFKSVYELYNCETLPDLEINQKFTIFMRKVFIEGDLFKNHNKIIETGGHLDITNVFKYNKSFLEFQRCEILATNAALNFWKELQQKNFDAKRLQNHGYDIATHFANIQECVKNIQAYHPTDIKIHFRYGIFLINVINNEYEGIDQLTKANAIQQGIVSAKTGAKTQSKNRGIGVNIENSGASIIIISALIGDEGRMLHTNDETELLFGYKRKDMIGRNVSMLMPYIIGQVHSTFVKRYLVNGKIDWGENIKQTYAVGKDGFMIPIDLLIKVYPAITGDIKIVGIIQQRFEDSELLTTSSSRVEMQDKSSDSSQLLILTDNKGNISNISAGIVRSLGLLPKFFVYNPDNLFSLINIDTIAPFLVDQAFQESLLLEGQVVSYNTTDILMKIDAEAVTHEELENAKPFMRVCEAHTVMKIIPLQDNLHACLYILRMRGEYSDEMISQDGEKFRRRSGSKMIGNSGIKNEKSGQELDLSKSSLENQDMNSQSSVATTVNSFNGLVRDFKKTLGDRRMPKSLLILNRLIFIILLVTIFLQSFFYARLNIAVEHLEETATTYLTTQRRNVMFVLLALNIRSGISIGNQLAPNKFSLDALNAIIDRYSLLNKMIQQQQEEVQGLHNYLSQLQRNDEDSVAINEIEHIPVNLLYVDNLNRLTNYQQPFRLALNSFLSDILKLNNTPMNDIYLPSDYVTISPRGDYNFSLSPTSLKLKSVYFLITNGVRVLRSYTNIATDQISLAINSAESTSSQTTTFLTVMVVGILITTASLSLVIFQIRQTENIQSDILSLYAYLSMDHINETYSRAIRYMSDLVTASFLKQIAPYKEASGGEFNQTQWVGYDESQSIDSADLGKDKDAYELMILRAAQEIRILQCPDLLLKSQNQKIQLKPKKNVIKELASTNQSKTSSKQKGDKNFRKMFKESKKNRSKVSDDTTKSSKGAKGGKVKLHKEHQQTKASKKLEIATGGKKVVQIMMEEQEDSASSSENSHRHEVPKKLSSEDQVDLAYKAKTERSEVEQRKAQFKKTYRSKNSWRKTSVVMVGLVIISYFIMTYAVHLNFEVTLQYLDRVVPIVLNRYRDIMLTFGIARERVFFNNTLDSMEYDPKYGFDLDYMYNDLSIENEVEISNLKYERASVSEDIIQQMSEFDSPNFCSKVIKDSLTSGETFIDDELDNYLLPHSTIKYQGLIATVSRAINAARLGRIDILRNLEAVYEMNFDLGDYDGRTPLYFAVRNYQTNTVLYLLDEIGVQINKKDRYGAHPVDYVGYNSKMEKVLYARGAKRTTVKNPIQLQPIAVNKYTIKDNEVRVFWAAYYGDLYTIQILDKMGINLFVKDFDSRTPLHIAASEGYLDVTKYLLNRGSQINALDARNNAPRNDSIREGKQAVADLINSVQSTLVVNSQCKIFANGVLTNGMGQAVGSYHKRFQDLQTFIGSTNDFLRRQTLIYGERFNASKILTAAQIFTNKVIPEFFQAQELFIGRILSQSTTQLQSTFDSTFAGYLQLCQILFACYLVFQVLVLLIVRGKMIAQMRNDIFESRGILNLIPNHFFENNKQIVEGIMKKLKY